MTVSGKKVVGIGLAVGAALGITATLAPPAKATRNSVGTYTLPGGNPVVSGTTISSAWANNTLGDIAVELTNSLDRQGRGAMLAPLQLVQGTPGAPALTFAGDLDTGLYRAGNGDVRMQVDGAQTLTFRPAGTLTPGTAEVGEIQVNGESNFSGLSTFSDSVVMEDTLKVTGASTFNGAASFVSPVSLTSGGPALTLKPGGANHVYAEFYSDSASPSTRSGFIGYSAAGSSDFAVVNSKPGGNIILSTTNYVSSNAPVRLTSSNPSATTPFTNSLTPKNVVKAWARVRAAGSGSTAVTIEEGFNISAARVQTGTGYLEFDLASPMLSPNYTVIVAGGSRYMSCGVEITAASMFRVGCKDISSALIPLPDIDFQINTNPTISRAHVVVLGAQ